MIILKKYQIIIITKRENKEKVKKRKIMKILKKKHILIIIQLNYEKNIKLIKKQKKKIMGV